MTPFYIFPELQAAADELAAELNSLMAEVVADAQDIAAIVAGQP